MRRPDSPQRELTDNRQHVYRRQVPTGRMNDSSQEWRIAVVCADCSCQHDPRSWRTMTCSGCDRTVVTRSHFNMEYDHDKALAFQDRIRVFCSQRCRSRHDHDRATTRRLEKRIEAGPVHCTECREVIEVRRSDGVTALAVPTARLSQAKKRGSCMTDSTPLPLPEPPREPGQPR